MSTRKSFLSISHINIRLSISILLSKLILLEFLAAVLVIFLHISFTFLEVDSLNRLNALFSIPIYGIFVLLKTILMFSIILQWLNEYFEITPTIIYHRKGLIFKTEEKYHIADVAQVEVDQGAFGKIFNYGMISLYDERRNNILNMNYIHNPMRYAAVLNSLTPRASEVKHILREQFIEEDNFDKISTYTS